MNYLNNPHKLYRKEGDKEFIHCNHCRVITRHQLKSFHRSPCYIYVLPTDEPFPDEEAFNEGEGYVEFRFWYCLGCDSGTMEIVYNEGEPHIPSNEYYPPRQKFQIRYNRYIKLPKHLKEIYFEVITAFHNELPILCATGLRALLEGICVDKGLSKKKFNTLEKKIEGLKEIHLPANIVEHLHSYRFLGNKAVHNLEAPSQYVLSNAIIVMHDILNFLYDLDYKAGFMSRMIKNQRPRK